MKFSDRVKTYNFWVSIASAIFLIINLIGKRFNFTIDESVYDDIFTTFCSVLVLLGIIVPPTNLKGQIYFYGHNNLFDEDDCENEKKIETENEDKESKSEENSDKEEKN